MMPIRTLSTLSCGSALRSTHHGRLEGFINDPNLDGTFDVELGLHRARELLCWLAELELPLATEALDPIQPQYLAELFSWSAIGARTTESQTHRRWPPASPCRSASRTAPTAAWAPPSMPLQAASQPHAFMGINQQGQVALLQTRANPDGHVILRGGSGTRTSRLGQSLAEEALEGGPAARPGGGLQPRQLQQGSPAAAKVADSVIHQIQEGNRSIARGDARIQPVRGQPVQRAAQGADALRCLHHRCLHRLGDHGWICWPAANQLAAPLKPEPRRKPWYLVITD